MTEFRVSDFLTLKLELGKTNIYVKGKLFNQCKRLLIDIPIDDIEQYEGISVDEIYDSLIIQQGQGMKYDIDPETEFWAHCSNIQMWYENDYDTRLMHGNLSFPLLKGLVEVGDPIANKVFKSEIVKRFDETHPAGIKYILEQKLLNYLDIDEMCPFFDQNQYLFNFDFSKPYPNDSYSIINIADMLLDAFNNNKLNQKYSLILFNILHFFLKYSGYKSDTYELFLYLIKNANDDDNDDPIGFYDLLGYFKETSYLRTVDSFSELLKTAQGIDVSKSYFSLFLNSIKKMHFRDRKYCFELLNGLYKEEIMKMIIDLKNEFELKSNDEALTIIKKRLGIEEETKKNIFHSKNIVLQEFIVNDHISLRLEDFHEKNLPDYEMYDQYTTIYIKDIPFIEIWPDQINSLFIVNNNISFFFYSEAVYQADQADECHDWKYLSTVQAFQTHCSHIKSWIDSNYDTSLLHINIAFILLEKLVNIGDLSEKKLKKEIIRRFENGEKYVMEYLELNGFLEKHLTEKELTLSIKRIVKKKRKIGDVDFVTWILDYFSPYG